MEKFHRWTDCKGDLTSVLTKDELLTNISIYWFSRNITSSFRIYYEFIHTDIKSVSGNLSPSGASKNLLNTYCKVCLLAHVLIPFSVCACKWVKDEKFLNGSGLVGQLRAMAEFCQ